MTMNKQSSADFLIIGQGLAGTLLAHFLEKAGKQVLLIDNHHQGAASKVAAGIINPITGRRFVKSWRIAEFFEFARTTYQEIEQLLEIKCWKEQHILRGLFNPREENNWLTRSILPEIEPYVVEPPRAEGLADKVLQPLSWMELKGGAQINLPLVIQEYRSYWKAKGQLLEEAFDYEELIIDKERIRYKDLEAKQLIFCEGHQGRFNPWFGELGFEVSKGEVLQLEIPQLQFERLLKHRLILAPLGKDQYWLGSKYEWNAPHDHPTAEGKTELLEAIKKILQVPYTITAHRAAIRPTTKDRRPLLGLHPKYPNLAIFNGLGTKGASLGPFWAQEMTDFLVNNKPLEKQVNIVRYQEK